MITRLSLFFLVAVGSGSIFQASRVCDPSGKDAEYEESIDLIGRKRIIKTNSCPDHFSVCQAAECAELATYALQRDVVIELPLYPVMAKDEFIRSLRCSSDNVAVALNGVAIQTIYDGLDSCMTPSEYENQNGIGSECNLNGLNDGTRFCGDHVESHANSLDKCGGHTHVYTEGNTGIYHYHIPPSCLMKDIAAKIQRTESDSVAVVAHHSFQLGWAYDGFPVYGPKGPSGIVSFETFTVFIFFLSMLSFIINKYDIFLVIN